MPHPYATPATLPAARPNQRSVSLQYFKSCTHVILSTYLLVEKILPTLLFWTPAHTGTLWNGGCACPQKCYTEKSQMWIQQMKWGSLVHTLPFEMLPRFFIG